MRKATTPFRHESLGSAAAKTVSACGFDPCLRPAQRQAKSQASLEAMLESTSGQSARRCSGCTSRGPRPIRQAQKAMGVSHTHSPPAGAQALASSGGAGLRAMALHQPTSQNQLSRRGCGSQVGLQLKLADHPRLVVVADLKPSGAHCASPARGQGLAGRASKRRRLTPAGPPISFPFSSHSAQGHSSAYCQKGRLQKPV